MRRALLYCAAIAFAIACGDSITEPVPPTPPVSFATSTSDDGLSITTDKDDYAPGDTVHFTGTGWQPGDSLDIVLVDDPITHESHTWAVGVGDDGTFHDSTYVVDTGDIGVTFTLTATSRATGRSLTVTFTDGNVRVQAAPNVSGHQFKVTAVKYTGTGCANGTTTSIGPLTVSTSPPTTLAGVDAGQSILITAEPTTTVGILGATFDSWSGGTVVGSPNVICVSGDNGAQTFTATYNLPIDLSITKTHVDPFAVTSPVSNFAYTITVGNVETAATSGAITVQDLLAPGLGFVSGVSGSPGWSCTGTTLVAPDPNAGRVRVLCSRGGGQSIAAGATNAITLTVSVGAQTAATFTNVATASGGTEPATNVGANNTASDLTHVTGGFVPGPTKLAFTSTAFGTIASPVVVGQCSPQITVQTQNGGAPVNVAADLSVNLSTTSAGGAFYSNPGCTTLLSPAEVTVQAAQNSASFYYKDSKAGAPKLTAAATGLTSADQTEDIDKADQTINFAALGGKTYGDADFSVSATASSGLAVSFAASGNCTVTGSTVHITDAGSCTITASQDGNDDYNAATSVPQQFTIDKAPLTITVDNKSREYGKSNPTLTGTLTGVVNNDGITATYSTTATQNSDVGEYEITVALVDPNGRLGNYNVPDPMPKGKLEITKAPLTVTAENKQKTYNGQVFTPFTVEYSGFVLDQDKSVLGGTLSFTGDAVTAKDAGKYTITPAGLTSGNYDIAFKDGELTIDKATLTVTAVDRQKVWDGQPYTFNTDPHTTTDVTYSGFVNSEGSSVLSGPLSFSASSQTAVGEFTNTPGGLTATNYKFTYVAGKLVIQAWTITGFFQPVDMSAGGNIWNTTKGGYTVPLKFRVFAGTIEKTDVAAIKSFKEQKLTCPNTPATDEIEVNTTGGTSLRYDFSAGQFVQNWQTPKPANFCYRVTMTTLDDSYITALFKTR